MDFYQEEYEPLCQQFIEECFKGSGKLYVETFNFGRRKYLLSYMLFKVYREMENLNPETQEYKKLFTIKKRIEKILSC